MMYIGLYYIYAYAYPFVMTQCNISRHIRPVIIDVLEYLEHNKIHEEARSVQ